LEMDWVEKNARGVQASDASDYESEISMLYSIIENDKRLLAKKLSPAFYETPMIENNNWKTKVEGITENKKGMIAYLAIGLLLSGLGYFYFSGKLVL